MRTDQNSPNTTPRSTRKAPLRSAPQYGRSEKATTTSMPFASLEIEASETTQQQLKAMVGDRLKHPSSRYKRMIDPEEGGRRCWTIKYADESKFHLDILPSVPDDYAWLIALGVPEEWAKSAICITDRETWKTDLNWPRSNPKGYAAWFKERMQERLYEQKLALARAERAEVEEIEDFEVRTPLQRMIQLLKRHRDVRYDGG